MSGRQSSAVDKALRDVAQGIALSTIYRALKRQAEPVRRKL
jgi:Fe2+ or Zn2+ uptake regulation protein